MAPGLNPRREKWEGARDAASGKISGAAPKAAISALRAKRHRRADCRLSAISWRAARSPTTDLGRWTKLIRFLGCLLRCSFLLTLCLFFLLGLPHSVSLGALKAVVGSCA